MLYAHNVAELCFKQFQITYVLLIIVLFDKTELMYARCSW